jgi:hypothetical protein
MQYKQFCRKNKGGCAASFKNAVSIVAYINKILCVWGGGADARTSSVWH